MNHNVVVGTESNLLWYASLGIIKVRGLRTLPAALEELARTLRDLAELQIGYEKMPSDK